MKKKLISMMLTAVMAFSLLAGCGAKEEAEPEAQENTAQADKEQAEEPAKQEESSEEKTTFTVGFDAEYPPYGYMDENGEYTGFDLELAQAVCDLEGWELVKTPISWDSKDMELESGTIDCIWNGFTMNGREDEYTWSDPYLDNQQVFVVRSGSGIESEEDLAGKIVDVQTESSAQAALDDNPELADTFGTLQVIPDYDTGFMELESGAVDAVAMDIVVASYQIESRGADFTILDESIATEEYGIGFAKGNEALRDTVQATLEEMAADGTMAEISEKWFGEDITTIGK